MKLPQARFITSATKLENCPPSDGRPEFATVMKVLGTLGIQLVAKPKAA